MKATYRSCGQSTRVYIQVAVRQRWLAVFHWMGVHIV